MKSRFMEQFQRHKYATVYLHLIIYSLLQFHSAYALMRLHQIRFLCYNFGMNAKHLIIMTFSWFSLELKKIAAEKL